MAKNPTPEAIIRRLSRVRAIELQLVDRLDQLGRASALDPEERKTFTHRSALAARHGLALEELASRAGAELHRSEPTGGDREGDRTPSVLLEGAVAAAASAVVAYGALYASARLLYESEVCDLADAHAADWAHELPARNDLLAPTVHRELLSDGLTCRCVCPACGIGACGCARNGIDTIRGHWGRPGLEPGEGLELRVPPRPGASLRKRASRERTGSSRSTASWWVPTQRSSERCAVIRSVSRCRWRSFGPENPRRSASPVSATYRRSHSLLRS